MSGKFITVAVVFIFIILLILVCSAIYELLYPEDTADNKNSKQDDGVQATTDS
jgi:Na+-transporting methylmalonyl-CoA/oxaloacetate decarboxylase gamma subunit